MASKKIQTNKCATVIGDILASYKKYVEFGYPNDPNVYEVRASAEIIEQLVEYVPTIKFNSDSVWPFKFVEDTNVGLGLVIFGPEQVTLEWRNDYGM
jgi:hypothetical protein